MTWEKVLYINEKVGVWDLVIDPLDPNTLYASSWNRIRERWSDPVPGGEDGLHKTTDGGETWKPINSGLPDTELTGRIGISLCLSMPNVLYAFVDNHNLGREAREGERDAYGRQKVGRQIVGAEVYRSDDHGEHWTKVSVSDARMETFGGTYGWMVIPELDMVVVFTGGVYGANLNQLFHPILTEHVLPAVEPSSQRDRGQSD